MNVIECRNVTKLYGGKPALHQLSFSIEENKITGLIGRNGAGKTTLLRILAGYMKQTSGDVRVFSQSPFNNLSVSANTIFIDDRIHFPSSITLGEALKVMEMFYERWDRKLAERLFSYFSFRDNDLHAHLSKGMKSTFHAILGIASRAPLTMFDEPTTGMDQVVRKDFYRALLKDYLACPRTIILSSHHLNELEDLLEDVLLLDEGEKRLHVPMTQLKEWALHISGNIDVVTKWTEQKERLHEQEIGSEKHVVVKNTFSDKQVEEMKMSGIRISPVAPHDVCVYLTKKKEGGIDDVFM